MTQAIDGLYSKDANAFMMTIPETKQFLQGAIYYGPVAGADTKLYEKENKWYRVTIPCLSCLGLKEYNNESAIVEVLEVNIE